MASVDFYYDFSCPWSYLGLMRLTEAAKRTGSDIHWRPVVLDELLAMVNPGTPISREPADPRKAKYQADDLDAWATYVGIAVNRPDGWPAASGLAAAGAIVADRERKIAIYSETAFSAYFGLGRDIADKTVLGHVADSSGLDRDAFERALDDHANADVVAEHTNSLFARGGFGTPTMFVDDQMFFGNDRMPLVEFALGQNSGRTFVMPGEHR